MVSLKKHDYFYENLEYIRHRGYHTFHHGTPIGGNKYINCKMLNTNQLEALDIFKEGMGWDE